MLVSSSEAANDSSGIWRGGLLFNGCPKDHKNIRISHSGSTDQYKGIPENMVGRILMFMWSLAALVEGGSGRDVKAGATFGTSIKHTCPWFGRFLIWHQHRCPHISGDGRQEERIEALSISTTVVNSLRARFLLAQIRQAYTNSQRRSLKRIPRRV